MAGRLADPLLASFAEASGSWTQRLDEIRNSALELTRSMEETPGPSNKQPVSEEAGPPTPTASSMTAPTGVYADSASSPGANVQGLPLNQGEAGAGISMESIASSLFESGFGMAALVKGLMGIFVGGGSTQQPLEKYEMPSPIEFETAVSSSGVSAGSFDQSGAMRAVSDAETGASGASGGTQSVSSPQITVQVQAMDAQSFLDHSDDIAQAVRGAMLSMRSINDVVNEL